MRRLVFLVLGVVELAACGLLLSFAWQLPGSDDVDEAVDRVEKVSRNASKQVRNLRQQVGRVRKRQPQLLALSRKLELQMKGVKKNLKNRRLNADGMET